MSKRLTLYFLCIVGSLSLLAASLHVGELSPKNNTAESVSKAGTAGEPVKNYTHTIVVEMGPYDLHRKYKIMEGPYAVATFRVGKSIDKVINVPENSVRFVENEQTQQPAKNLVHKPTGTCWLSKYLPGTTAKSIPPMDLYWFTGARVDVVDESGHVLPKPIYLCHGRLDLFSKARRRLFPDSTVGPNGRLCLFTQGCNVITLPEGYGVPIAAGEKMCVNLKALNLSTSAHKRIKLRCTIFLCNDRQLNHPMSALNWQVAHVSVIVNGASAPTSECCSTSAQTHQPGSSQTYQTGSPMCCLSTGQNAPNNVTHWLVKNKAGQLLSGHWVVPPGVHTYSAPVGAPYCSGFALNGPIRAAWAHVHPFCRTLSLVESINGKKRNVFTIHATTTTATGARLAHIDLLNAPQGLPLNKNASYFLTATYDNTSGKPQDSMAIAGIFFSDLKFKKPAWVRAS